MRILVVLVLSVSLGGCYKHSAICWQQGKASSVNAELGYFYDSATVSMAGPASFKRVPIEFTKDPCVGLPPLEE